MDKFTLIGYVGMTDQDGKINAYLLYFTQPVFRNGAGSVICTIPGQSGILPLWRKNLMIFLEKFLKQDTATAKFLRKHLSSGAKV